MTQVIDEPIIEEDHETKKHQNVKPMKNYVVIVLNDDDHTIDYVMLMFQKVFHYSIEKSAKLTAEIHTKGQAVVWSGSKEVAELKQEQIQSMGVDHFSTRLVDYPLGVDIRQL